MHWKTLEFQILNQTLVLHPLKAIFWVEQQMLLLADLHLGKARHFRKEGFAVPEGVGDSNWDKLITLFVDFRPERVLFLGDLFHSVHNRDWEEFTGLLERFPAISFELIPGNHDIFPEEVYENSPLKKQADRLIIGPFVCSHHPLEGIDTGYNLAGHIHPCVHLRGRARQRLRLPCFYFGQRQGILPAFGSFTGMASVNVQEGDQVFVISEDQVLEVS